VGRWGAFTHTEALVELIDLVPTLLECCRVKIPENLHGRSLLPLLRGETNQHRDRVFVEYSDNAESAVRTPRWKLIYGAGGRHRRDGYFRPGSDLQRIELYDLAYDPDEVVNRANDPLCRDVLEELLQTLVDHVRRTIRYPEALQGITNPTEILFIGLHPAELLDRG
jgi:choline-sulfatase